MFTSASLVTIGFSVVTGVLGYWLRHRQGNSPATPATPTPAPANPATPAPAPAGPGPAVPAPTPAPVPDNHPARSVWESLLSSPELLAAVQMLIDRMAQQKQVEAHELLYKLADPVPQVTAPPIVITPTK